MRNARPFDNPGTHVTYNAQATKQSLDHKWGGRGSLIASTTTDTFGILLGVAGNRTAIARRPASRSIGWTNPNLSAAQCGATIGLQPHRRRQLDDPRHGAGQCRQRPDHRHDDRSAPSCSRTIRARRSSRSTTACSRAWAARSTITARATASTRSLSAEWRPTDDLHFYRRRPVRLEDQRAASASTWTGSAATAPRSRSTRPTTRRIARRAAP